MTASGMRVLSTLGRRKAPLETGLDGVVRIYFCGPTVYGPIHIGNARPYIVFSVLKRYLTRSGYAVKLVSNLTDVNDKIYDAARREGVPSGELAARFSAQYVADTDRLGLGRPDLEPKVTESVPEIVALIESLVTGGLAYAAEGDVYFRVRDFPAYGQLSGRKTEDMDSTDPGTGKESPLDFALWKGRKPDEDTWWESPWGPGRPGWHIECSAMAETALGREFEIHGGGIDLAFPHHENELAQSEGAHGGRMAKAWMHNEMLELGGDKMSKSDGNIALLRDVLDAWPAETVIAFMLTRHYRSKLPYSDDELAEAERVCERFRNAFRTIDRALGAPGQTTDAELAAALISGRVAFHAALDDDFNTPGGIAALFDLVRAINRACEGTARPSHGQLQEVRRELSSLLDMLGLGRLADAAVGVPPEVERLVAEREAARAARDFARSDAARDALLDLGYEVRDTPEGPQVTARQ
jgi:cysteinyl-tRNA synthetase